MQKLRLFVLCFAILFARLRVIRDWLSINSRHGNTDRKSALLSNTNTYMNTPRHTTIGECICKNTCHTFVFVIDGSNVRSSHCSSRVVTIRIFGGALWLKCTNRRTAGEWIKPPALVSKCGFYRVYLIWMYMAAAFWQYFFSLLPHIICNAIPPANAMRARHAYLWTDECMWIAAVLGYVMMCN